ncbi:MAG: FoF1 ATP synthase subunit gamma [Alphaproteobacteria bacterium]
MQTLEGLRRKLATTKDLRDIVSTMKTLSAVSINQFERAAVSLGEYDKTVREGLKAVLKGGDAMFNFDANSEKQTLVVVFGSDLGLVGRFNKEITKTAVEYLSKNGLEKDAEFIALGRRCFPLVESMGKKPVGFFTLPSAVKDIVPAAMALLVKIDDLCQEKNIKRVVLFNNCKKGNSFAVPVTTEILPISNDFIKEIKDEKWPTNQQPIHRTATRELFSSLIKEQLLTWLCRACAESLASEYATRLATMQAAEKNIDEHIDNLTMEFQQKRQDSITNELLDVVSGSEVLKSSK